MADAVATVQARGKTVAKQPLVIAANMGSYNVAGGGAATVTCTPTTGKRVMIPWMDFGYRVAPTAGSIQISDGTTVWGPFTVIAGGLQHVIFDPPLMFKTNGQVTVTMGDGSQVKDLFVPFAEEGGVAY